MLSSNAGYREVQAMGWLSEQVHLGGDSSHTEWKPVFVALTEKDMLLYVAAPWSREDWSAPVMSHPLLATRWVKFGLTGNIDLHVRKLTVILSAPEHSIDQAYSALRLWLHSSLSTLPCSPPTLQSLVLTFQHPL